MKEDLAPRTRYYPDDRHTIRDITVHDIYKGEIVFKDSLTNFSHKLYHHVTKSDPYVTQCDQLPSLVECFSVADCLIAE